jgi:hypothetical protein
MKKGQGMSLNVVVIATLVVLILIVLSVLFIRGTGDFSRDTQSCIVLGGICVEDSRCTSQGDIANLINLDPEKKYTFNPKGKCPDEKYCCIPVKTELE